MTPRALAVVLLALLLGCGVKAPPRPPERGTAAPEPAGAGTTSHPAAGAR